MPFTYDSSTGKASANKLAITTNTTAAASGEFGEVVSASITTDTATASANTELDISGASISLTAGFWLVFIGVTNEINSTAGASGVSVYNRIRMTDNSNSAISGSAIYNEYRTEANAGANNFHIFYSTLILPLTVASTTTYKLRLIANATSGGVTGYILGADQGTFTGQDNDTYFYAVRIR